MKNLKNLLRKIDTSIAKIPLDFTLHIIVSAILVWVIMVIIGISCGDLLLSAFIGAVLSLSIGVAKETIIDTLIKDSMPDQRDIIADVCGTCLGLLLVISGALVF